MKLFIWMSALAFTFATIGCGDSGPSSSVPVCQAAIDANAVCDPDVARTDAEIADCEAGNASISQECSDATVAMMNCQADNEACTDEAFMASCMTEAMAADQACPDPEG